MYKDCALSGQEENVGKATLQDLYATTGYAIWMFKAATEMLKADIEKLKTHPKKIPLPKASINKREVVLALCHCAKLALRYIPKKEPRPALAVYSAYEVMGCPSLIDCAIDKANGSFKYAVKAYNKKNYSALWAGVGIDQTVLVALLLHDEENQFKQKTWETYKSWTSMSDMWLIPTLIAGAAGFDVDDDHQSNRWAAASLGVQREMADIFRATVKL